jgi:adenylosuccinate lyase
MSRLVKKYQNELQIGRTHGQHALPITVGFWLATILHRMCYNFREMQKGSFGLVGKISGAVGAYNAQIGLGAVSLFGEKNFEERVLWKLGLEPSKISTQILPPEPLAYYLFSCVMMSASLAQLGRDCRHLMRSEIGEISEEFSAEQSGSSTMAHKRNPINFEQVEGTYTKNIAEFMKVLMTPISEHQRDLTGSCVARDFPTIIVNLVTQLNTLLRENERGIAFLERITVNSEACKRNFQMNRDVILSEPLYIAIQMAGFEGDGHKLVNHTLVPRALEQHRLLVDIASDYAQEDAAFGEVWERIPNQIMETLWNPEKYIGDAVAKTKQVLDEAEELLAT